MGDERQEGRQVEPDQALDQVELAGEGDAEARIDPAGDRQDRPQHAEAQHEDQRPEKIGDRLDQAGQAVDHDLRPAAAPDRGGQRQRQAEAGGDEQREKRQLDRRRQAAEHQAEYVLAQADRGAEIALQQGAEPSDELRGDRPVEAVERAQVFDVGLAGAGRDHHRDRIARDHPQQDEDDDRDPEQRRQGQ